MEKLKRDEITQPVTTSEPDVMDSEDQAWMDADLSRLGEFEPYEWEPDELEEGKPVQHVPGKGTIISTNDVDIYHASYFLTELRCFITVELRQVLSSDFYLHW